MTGRAEAVAQDKARVGRPEEVVRLYDTLASLTTELSDVAAALGGVAGEALLDFTAAQVACCLQPPLLSTPDKC